jgi:chemotaxis receptor (MCP) glutamine deamidase CheD
MEKIKITEKDIKGENGRTMMFNTKNGKVQIKSIQGEKVI